MPGLHLYFAFVAAVTVLMLIPGPNVALIVANSVTYGFRYGLLTVAGTSSAMLVQLALTALGMTEILGQLGQWFDWIRWIGVAYLVYLGITTWRAAPLKLNEIRAEPKSAKAMYTRALLVSLTNPKTLFFYGAFFPQFIVTSQNVGLQVTILSATFVFLAIAVDSAWAILANRARGFPAMHGKLRNRISGGILIGAGIGLAFARRS